MSEKELHLIQEVAENLFRKNILDKKMGDLLLNLDLEYFTESNVISDEEYETLLKKKKLTNSEEEELNDYRVFSILDRLENVEHKLDMNRASF